MSAWQFICNVKHLYSDVIVLQNTQLNANPIFRGMYCIHYLITILSPVTTPLDTLTENKCYVQYISVRGIYYINILNMNIYVCCVSHNDIVDNKLETVIEQVSLSYFRQAKGH